MLNIRIYLILLLFGILSGCKIHDEAETDQKIYSLLHLSKSKDFEIEHKYTQLVKAIEMNGNNPRETVFLDIIDTMFDKKEEFFKNDTSKAILLYSEFLINTIYPKIRPKENLIFISKKLDTAIVYISNYSTDFSKSQSKTDSIFLNLWIQEFEINIINYYDGYVNKEWAMYENSVCFTNKEKYYVNDTVVVTFVPLEYYNISQRFYNLKVNHFEFYCNSKASKDYVLSVTGTIVTCMFIAKEKGNYLIGGTLTGKKYTNEDFGMGFGTYNLIVE